MSDSVFQFVALFIAALCAALGAHYFNWLVGIVMFPLSLAIVAWMLNDSEVPRG